MWQLLLGRRPFCIQVAQACSKWNSTLSYSYQNYLCLFFVRFGSLENTKLVFRKLKIFFWKWAFCDQVSYLQNKCEVEFSAAWLSPAHSNFTRFLVKSDSTDRLVLIRTLESRHESAKSDSRILRFTWIFFKLNFRRIFQAQLNFRPL